MLHTLCYFCRSGSAAHHRGKRWIKKFKRLALNVILTYQYIGFFFSWSGSTRKAFGYSTLPSTSNGVRCCSSSIQPASPKDWRSDPGHDWPPVRSIGTLQFGRNSIFYLTWLCGHSVLLDCKFASESKFCDSFFFFWFQSVRRGLVEERKLKLHFRGVGDFGSIVGSKKRYSSSSRGTQSRQTIVSAEFVSNAIGMGDGQANFMDATT